MVRHVILWKLKPEIQDGRRAELCAEIKSGLEALCGRIPGLIYLRVETGRLPSSSADLMLDSIFADEASLAAYRDNPAHTAVANTKVRPFVETRLCLDFAEK